MPLIVLIVLIVLMVPIVVFHSCLIPQKRGLCIGLSGVDGFPPARGDRVLVPRFAVGLRSGGDCATSPASSRRCFTPPKLPTATPLAAIQRVHDTRIPGSCRSSSAARAFPPSL